MQRVETEEAAKALADRLNGGDRDRPIVVVTTPSGRPEPWIDAAEVERQVGDLAEVVLMPTGAFTWAFSTGMPPMTQVFGGAGRVYPPGHAWATNPQASPLRFAYDADDGRRATDHLIDDAMTMAALAGVKAEDDKRRRTHCEAVVAGIVADRALVKLTGGGLGNVSPALAVPGLPVERVLVKGQPVSGWFDPATSWFDLRELALAPAVALTAYQVGEVVLAEVGEVREASAELFLHPLVPVVIGRDEVTGNDRDDLRTLLTRGEVVAARLTATGAEWRLSLLDVDDDEEPAVAVSLLRGGPPWLQPPVDDPVPWEPPTPEPDLEPPPEARPSTAAPTAPPRPEETAPAPIAPVRSDQPAPPPRPSPMMFDPRRRHLAPPAPSTVPDAPAPPAPPAAAPAPAPTGALEQMRREIDDLRSQLDGYRQEVGLLRQERAHLERRTAHLEKQLADQRVRLRKAKRPAPEATRPAFADAEQRFRYAVLTAWATRTPLAEQAAMPLPDYRIGPHFLASLEGLAGISDEKVADVAFEVLTGRAQELAGRGLHQYRESDGGGAPAVQRGDGSVLWRANLQTNSASARRLHFWRLPGGAVELWHVGTHDEKPPLT